MRNAVGPMDYTPVLSPSWNSNRQTIVQNVALAVVIECGVNSFADKPDTYRNSPAYDFFLNIPASWDETKFVDAIPDSHVVIARRSGENWYVGGVTNAARTIDLPLSFLGDGVYYAWIYRDGGATINDMAVEFVEVTKDTVVNLPMKATGGAALKITRSSTDDSYYWDFSDLKADSSVGRNSEKLNIAGAYEPVGQRAFTALNSAGTTTTGTEGAAQILVNNGSSKWCNTSLNLGNAWFILDAGEPIKMPGYVIRGANDDMSYTSRVLHSWTVEGSNSASGPWTTISSETGQGSGWTSNYQTRTFNFNSDAIPQTGFRYYRLQITRRDASANGTALGTSNTTMQFSYFGLFSGFMANGELGVTARSSATEQDGILTINSLNGSNTINVTGNVSDTASAPFTSRNFATIKRGIYIKVQPDTKLSYMFKPKNAVSAHMAIDVEFTDGTRLRDLNAADQFGIKANPKAQGEGGALKTGQWNYVEIDLGAVAAGKIIYWISLGFEVDDATPGGEIDGSFDYIAVFRGKFDSANVRVHAGLYSAGGKLISSSVSDPTDIYVFSTVVLNNPLVLDKRAAGAGYYIKIFKWATDTFIPVTEPYFY